MRRTVLSFVLPTLVACTHASSGDPTGNAPATETPATPVVASHAKGAPIATIATRDAKVTILAHDGADRDIRVVVRKGGSIVAEGISVDELRAADPALHAIVTNAIASRKDATWVDATLDVPTSQDVDPAMSAGAGPAIGRHRR
jgi:hypothetical protein